MSTTESGDTTVVKRGPGRPPNKKKETKLVRSGIVKQPSNAGSEHEHTVEIIYDNPLMFKKIFGLFKEYNVIQIEVMFDVNKTYMYAMNHHNTVSIMAEILGEQMNSYYVAAPLYMSFDTKSFHNIFKGINKDYNQIMFATNAAFQNANIWMVFEREYHASKYKIELNTQNDNSAMLKHSILKSVNQNVDYLVSFDINFKELKDKISEYSHITKKINIELVSSYSKSNQLQSYVEFTCSDASGKINNISLYTNPSSMNLVSKCDNISTFIAPMWINNIEPLARSLISDKIRFHVDEHQDMVFVTELDLDLKGKKSVPGTEKCVIKLAARLAFSDENPISSYITQILG